MAWQPFGWDVDWGNVPGGVGAILTSVSVLVASLAYRRSVMNGETSQADKVAAWFHNQESGYLEMAVVSIRNSSDLPIYMTELYLGMGRTRKRAERYFVGTIEPESTREVQTGTLMASGVPPTEIAFRDARGIYWRRTEDGKLHRQDIKRIQTIARQLRIYVIHPSKLRELIPRRYERESFDTSPEWRRRAIEAAEDMMDASPRQAKRAVDRYITNKRMTFRQYVISSRAAVFVSNSAYEEQFTTDDIDDEQA